MFSRTLLRDQVHYAFVVFFLVSFVLILMQVKGKFSVESNQQRQVDGIVLSLKPERFNHTQRVLHQLGLKVVQRLPPHFQSPELNRSLVAFQGHNHHDDSTLKYWSNQMGFVSAMKEFILESKATPKRWRFFFEDDLGLYPGVAPENLTLALHRGLEVADEEGFAFLGLCGPHCAQESTVDLGESVEASACHGLCSHAFAFQVHGAEAFLTWMENEQVDRTVVLDQSLLIYGRDVKGMWLIGSNLQSPVGGDHYGLLYQDRVRFPSTMG